MRRRGNWMCEFVSCRWVARGAVCLILLTLPVHSSKIAAAQSGAPTEKIDWIDASAQLDKCIEAVEFMERESEIFEVVSDPALLAMLTLLGPVGASFIGELYGALAPYDEDKALQLHNDAGWNNLLDRFEKAEQAYRGSLAVQEEVYGPNHPYVARTLCKLASVYSKQGRYGDAVPLYKRLLAIFKTILGPEHRFVGQTLYDLANLHMAQGRYGEAEPLLERALPLQEETLGPDHRDVGQTLYKRAVLYMKQRRYGEALPLLKRALTIFEETKGADHPDLAGMRAMITMIQEMSDREPEAEEMEFRAQAIRSKYAQQ